MTPERKEGRTARWRNHLHGRKEIGSKNYVDENDTQMVLAGREGSPQGDETAGVTEVGRRQMDGARRVVNDSYLVGQIKQL